MLESFRRGLAQASRSWAMLLVLLVASIFFALPVVAPIFLLIAQTSAKTVEPHRLLADQLNVFWLIDLFNQRLAGASLEGALAQGALVIGVMGFFYLLANVLFAGGILGVYQHADGRFSHARFWAGAGRYFPRFLRLWLLSLICYGAAILGYLLLLIPIEASDARASAERPGAIRHLVAVGMLILVLSAINMIFDYARIGAVVADRRRMFREVIVAAVFSFRYFRQTVGLYALLALTGAAVFALLVALRGAVVQSSLIAVLLAIVLGQAAIAARWWSRLTFYAAQLDLYRRLEPPIEQTSSPAPPPEPVFAKAVDTSELPSPPPTMPPDPSAEPSPGEEAPPSTDPPNDR